MPHALSQDLRVRIVARFDAGFSYEDVAEQFDVGINSVRRYVALERETGSLEPRPHAGGARKVLNDAERALLARCVEKWPDRTLKELTRLFNRASGHPVSVPTVGRELRGMGYTRKKNAQSRRAISPRRS